jgi:hypothetical protein
MAIPQQLIVLRPDVWRGCAELGWCMAPELDTKINTGEREVHLRTDEFGHRCGEIRPGRSIDVRILALGDSFLAGIQVEFDDLMTTLLERRLSDGGRGEVAVVNTGVGGWGPSHYLIKLRQELARGYFDAVVVFLFVGNDIEDARIDEFPARTASELHRLGIPRAMTRVELVGAIAYPINDLLERRSHLFVLLKNRSWALLMRAGLSARRFPPVYLKREADSSRWRVTADLCTEIADTAQKRGTPSVFVLLPGAYQVDEDLGRAYVRAIGLKPEDVDMDQPSVLMRKELEARGLCVVDALPALRAAQCLSENTLFGKVDTHLTPGGHAVLAATIFPAVNMILDGKDLCD